MFLFEMAKYLEFGIGIVEVMVDGRSLLASSKLHSGKRGWCEAPPKLRAHYTYHSRFKGLIITTFLPTYAEVGVSLRIAELRVLDLWG